jgi:hypothetical protein
MAGSDEIKTPEELLRLMYSDAQAEALTYSPVPEISTSSVDPQPEPQSKLHDDMTLADWKRAFANYDRKPWQTD